MKILIACAGSQHKWDGYLGLPSHLAPIGGEPLLARTVRMLRERTQDSIIITAPRGVEGYSIPDAVTCYCDTAFNEFAGTRELWNDYGRTVLLLGDVYFTAEALETILGCEAREWRSFGRRHGSRVTGCPYGEIFANSWWPEQHSKLDQILARQAKQKSGRRGGWEVHKEMTGVKKLGGGHEWVEIDDLTDDFDYPHDYNRHPAVRKILRDGSG